MAGIIEAILRLKTRGWKQDLDTAKADAGKFHKDVGGMFGGLGGKLAGALSVGAFAAGARSIVGFAGELADSSAAVNVSVEALQELRHAFGQSGASAEQVDKSLVKLNESLASARAGNQTTIESFRQLGVSLADIKTLSPDAILMKMADGFRAAADPSAALAASMDVLGKGGAKMAAGLMQGSDAIADLRGEVGTLSAETIAQLDMADDAIGKFMTGLKVKGGGFLIGLKEFLTGADRDKNAEARGEMGAAATDEELAKAREAMKARKQLRDSNKFNEPQDEHTKAFESEKQMIEEVAKVKEERRKAERKAFEENLDAEEKAIADAMDKAAEHYQALEDAKKDAANNAIEQQRAQAVAAEGKKQEKKNVIEQQIDDMTDDILAGPDARRERKRAEGKRNRARGKAIRALERAGVDVAGVDKKDDQGVKELGEIKSILKSIDDKTEPLT